MNWQTVVWIYIVLLVLGGLIGFMKAGSKISLVASVLFAMPLVLGLLLAWTVNVILILLGVHLLYFGSSFARKRKFMPGGLMATASLAAGLFIYFTTRR